jgi:acetyl/propionyl-CoA carboxylase alpha subunit
MDKLFFKIGENNYFAKYDKLDKSVVLVNDKPYQIELLKKFSDFIYSFSVNQRMCNVEFDFSHRNLITITSDGFSFEIDIADDLQKLIDQFIRQAKTGVNSDAAYIKAPMPGMVVKILVNEGDTVAIGDRLIIIEAMKMENALKSPIEATVGKIYVTEGMAVEKDAMLMEIVGGMNNEK